MHTDYHLAQILKKVIKCSIRNYSLYQVYSQFLMLQKYNQPKPSQCQNGMFRCPRIEFLCDRKC